jgi:ParB family transcriptional regulator, chromosome partitioning protein
MKESSLTTATVTLIPLDDLEPADDNLRGPVGDVTELARSIAGIGVVEPLLVCPIDGQADRYRIVAGRHAAARRAGVASVPCIVRTMTDAERIEVMLVENLQRATLGVLGEASGYFRLVGEHSYTIRRLAKQVGKSERHVRSRLALLELPAAAQRALERDELTLGQAEALLAAKDRPDVIEAVLAEPDWRRQDMEHAITAALRRAEHEDRRGQLVAELEAAGQRVMPSEGHRPKSYVPLSDLGVDDKAHQTEPCHAWVVEVGYAGPVSRAVCTDRRRHTHRAPSSDRSGLQATPRRPDPEREAAKERRRLAARRSEFVSSRLSGRVPKGPAVDFLVAALLDRTNSNDASRAGLLLGVEARPGRYGSDWHSPLAEVAARSEPDRLRVGVALATAMAEARIAASGYRNGARRYVDFLTGLGYEPDTEERTTTEAAEEDDADAVGDGSAQEPPPADVDATASTDCRR